MKFSLKVAYKNFKSSRSFTLVGFPEVSMSGPALTSTYNNHVPSTQNDKTCRFTVT